jgi:hypothetical protein
MVDEKVDLGAVVFDVPLEHRRAIGNGKLARGRDFASLVPDHCDGGSVTRGYVGRNPAQPKNKEG